MTTIVCVIFKFLYFGICLLVSHTNHSNFVIRLLRMFVFTTPPTPYAGMILHIRANALTPQSLVTLARRRAMEISPCLLYRSRPRRCIGVLISCIAAGAKNWAVLLRLDSVLRMPENCFCTEGGKSRSRGAINGGKLKEANIVMLSLIANKAYESIGIVAAGDLVLPNIFTNWLSLYTQMLILVAEVATNFVAPAVTFEAGFEFIVDVIVSIPFATKYVPKYKVKTRRNGFEIRNVCGRVIAGRSARRKHDLKVVFVAAFSIIDLRILSDSCNRRVELVLPINCADQGGNEKSSRGRRGSIRPSSQA